MQGVAKRDFRTFPMALKFTTVFAEPYKFVQIALQKMARFPMIVRAMQRRSRLGTVPSLDRGPSGRSGPERNPPLRR